MRYLIDTNIFVYMASDPEYLSKDVDAIILEPETILYMSAESVRELIVGYRNKGLCSKKWKSVEVMLAAIEKEYYIKILSSDTRFEFYRKQGLDLIFNKK